MKLEHFVFIGLLFILNSCDKGELHSISVQIFIKNNTKYNLHCIYDNKDYSFSDSVYNTIKDQKADSANQAGFIQCAIDTFIYRDDILSEVEFAELISRFKIYYIEKGDTFNVKDRFYDGKSCWDSESNRAIDGIIFIKHYWWTEYTASLSEDMFEK